MKLLVALCSLLSTVALAQDVDIRVPGMRVKMRSDTNTNTEVRVRGPRPPPVQVIGVDTFDLQYELKPQEALRLVSPEGAHADVWADDGSYVGGYEVPCEVHVAGGAFYRVVMTQNGVLVFDRKVEVRRYNRTNVLSRSAPPVVVVAPQPAYVQMVDFAALVEAVNAENFGDAKLDVVRTAEGGFTVDQLGQLVDLFNFSDEKVKVVEIVKPHLVDPQNAFKLYSRFTFDDDKKRVKAILGK